MVPSWSFNLLCIVVPLINAQTCSNNFVKASDGWFGSTSCPSSRSCKTTSDCCGACSSSGGNCYGFTCGDNCQDEQCSACPDGFDPLPSDQTGSRPSSGQSCPAAKPHKDVNRGCCGGCKGASNTVYAYDCGTVCSNSPCSGSSHFHTPPHAHSLHTHSPPASHTHSPPASHTHSPPASHTHSPAAPQIDGVCDVVNPVLAATPQCACAATTGGTGLITTCSESFSAVGVAAHVGVKVQLEPCGSPAFAQIQYQAGSTAIWEFGGRIEANGDPIAIPVPGFSFPVGASFSGVSYAGLVISVRMTGNAEDLSVDAHLSVCFEDKCDAELLTVFDSAGFPFKLLMFNDLAFVESCPASSSSIGAIIGGVVGALVVLGAIVAVVFIMKQKATTKQKAATSGTDPGAQATSVA